MDIFGGPYWLVMGGLIALAIGLGCGTHRFIQRTVPYAKLVEHNDVAGFMIAVVGVLYSVLMAFIVVAVWQQYNDSDANYGNEVSGVADIFAYSRMLRSERAQAVQMLVDRYVNEMVGDEWPAMRSGRASSVAAGTLAQLGDAVNAVVPATPSENDARTHLQAAVQRVFDLRNRRLSDNVETLPPVLWASLLIGAALTVGFGFLFGVKNRRIQLFMTGSVAALIAIMFTLLIELDFPFRRDTAISPGRWVELQHYLALVRAGTGTHEAK